MQQIEEAGYYAFLNISWLDKCYKYCLNIPFASYSVFAIINQHKFVSSLVNSVITMITVHLHGNMILL